MTSLILKTVTQKHNQLGVKATSYAEAAPASYENETAKTTSTAFVATTEKFNSVYQQVGPAGWLESSFLRRRASQCPTNPTTMITGRGVNR
jgi:hypothetical protein